MASIIRATTTSGLQVAPDNSGSLVLQTNGTTTAVTIDTSQNVGIGTSSPLDKLDVVSGSSTNRSRIRNSTGGESFILFQNSDTGTTTTDGLAVGIGLSEEAYVFNQENTALLFGTNNTERMRIDSSGNVCVGTTSASIYGTNTIAMVGSDGAAFKVTGGTGNDAIYSWNNATTGNNGFIRFLTETSATFRGEITYNRGSAVVSYGTSSDIRLKENIVDASSGLEKINGIKIRSFDWKETGIHTDFGVIAQELFNVAPEAVIEGDDKDIIEKTWQVDTSVLVPALIKAVQEQQTIINDLKARIETLEAK